MSRLTKNEGRHATRVVIVIFLHVMLYFFLIFFSIFGLNGSNDSLRYVKSVGENDTSGSSIYYGSVDTFADAFRLRGEENISIIISFHEPYQDSLTVEDVSLKGAEDLITVMTCNEIFNSERPDTFYEPV